MRATSFHFLSYPSSLLLAAPSYPTTPSPPTLAQDAKDAGSQGAAAQQAQHGEQEHDGIGLVHNPVCIAGGEGGRGERQRVRSTCFCTSGVRRQLMPDNVRRKACGA